MAVSLDTLITDLRRSYGDDLPEAEQALSLEQLRRAVHRGVVMVNRDFGAGYRIEGDAVTPGPTRQDHELVLLAGMVSVAEMMLARHARYPSVKSGDKTVSHDGQVDAWSRLHARYLEQYEDAVAVEKANDQFNVDPQLYG